VTDAQFFTAIVIAPCMTIAAIVLTAILNNARLTDVKEVLRAESRADIRDLRNEIEKRLDKLDAKMDEHLRVVLGKIEDVEKRR
jgi:hypothetical protein